MPSMLAETVGPQMLRPLPDPASTTSAFVLPGDTFDVIGTQGGWSEIRMRDGALQGRSGFLATAFIKAAPQPGAEIDEEEFFLALEALTGQLGGDRDYLFAVAVAESGLRNVPTEGDSEAFGPFQFTPGKWSDLVAAHPTVPLTTEADRFQWRAQCRFAVLSSLVDIDLARGALGRLPTGAELWMVHVLGTTGGPRLLSGPPDAAVGPGGLTSARAIRNNPSLFPRGAETTVSEVLAAAADKLRDGYARAGRLAARLDPAAPGQGPAVGDPPWLTLAFAELAKRVVEIPGLQSHPDVVKYFTATDHPPAGDETPWCGAFVAWCVANCGDPAAEQSVPKGSADASRWLKWGKPSTARQRGAVAVMLLGGQDHVGFVTRWDGDKVFLLAGNQGGGKVCELPAAGELLGMRMFP